MANVIELKKINKIYGTGQYQTHVLHDLDLAIVEGSFTSIIGQSGSGKSTLLNIIGTLDKPSDGEVWINGSRTDSMNKKDLAVLRNKTLGFIFQFHYLLPEFTAIENVLMPFRIKNGSAPKAAVERANEIMDMVGLEKVKNNPAPKMSGGQQQRTAIARALMNEPKIILADEPTGNLDSDTTETIYNLMREINKSLGTTFVIITHDRRIAEKADRIIEISDGRITMDF
ncbi:MAG: ABC transporter ATP-binding protein [Ruminococcaceae bacterium]|jgi:lipoprotein-releasing system ATP-binding protein|nr:ABC transporter ATP-binding protein [Oscillospiraceae bacterium]